MEIFGDQESLLVDSPSQGVDLSVEVVDGRTSIIRMAVAGMAIGLVASACNEQRVYFDELGSGQEDTLNIDDLDAGDASDSYNFDSGSDSGTYISDSGEFDTFDGADSEVQGSDDVQFEDVDSDAGFDSSQDTDLVDVDGSFDSGSDVISDASEVCSEDFTITAYHSDELGRGSLNRFGSEQEVFSIIVDSDDESGTFDSRFSFQVDKEFPSPGFRLGRTAYTDGVMTFSVVTPSGEVIECSPPAYDVDGRNGYEDGFIYSTSEVVCTDVPYQVGENAYSVRLNLGIGDVSGLSYSTFRALFSNDSISGFVNEEGTDVSHEVCRADLDRYVFATQRRRIEPGGIVEFEGFTPDVPRNVPLAQSDGQLLGNFNFNVIGDEVRVTSISGRIEARDGEGGFDASGLVDQVNVFGYQSSDVGLGGSFEVIEDSGLYSFMSIPNGARVIQFTVDFDRRSHEVGQEYRVCVDNIDTDASNADEDPSSDLGRSFEGVGCGPWVPVEDTSWSFPSFPK